MISFKAVNWWAGFFLETTVIKRTFFSSICARNSAACRCTIIRDRRKTHLYLFPPSASLLTLQGYLCTRVPPPFPSHQVNWSRPTCILDSPYKFCMTLAAEACAGSQHDPTHALWHAISPWELGGILKFPFLPCARFCRVYNVAIIVRKMGEISHLPFWEIVKYLLGHREKMSVLQKWTQDALGQKRKRRSLTSKDVHPMPAYSKVYKTLKQSWEQLSFSCLLGECPDNRAVVWKLGRPSPLATF